MYNVHILIHQTGEDRQNKEHAQGWGPETSQSITVSRCWSWHENQEPDESRVACERHTEKEAQCLHRQESLRQGGDEQALCSKRKAVAIMTVGVSEWTE